MYRIIIVLLTLAVVLPVAFLLYYGPQLETQYRPAPTGIEAAKAYFDTLNPAIIGTWIERSKKLMDAYDPNKDSSLSGAQLSNDLRSLNVVNVNVDRDEVASVWSTGLDHTEILVMRLPDKSFQVIAQYDNEHSKVVWPVGK